MTFCLERWVLTNFVTSWVLDLHLHHWKKFVFKVFKDSNCCEKMIYGKLKVGKMIIISPSASNGRSQLWAKQSIDRINFENCLFYLCIIFFKSPQLELQNLYFYPWFSKFPVLTKFLCFCCLKQKYVYFENYCWLTLSTCQIQTYCSIIVSGNWHFDIWGVWNCDWILSIYVRYYHRKPSQIIRILSIMY